MDHVIQFCLVLIARFVVWVRPAIPAICATFAWGITASFALSIVTMVRRGVANVRQLHRVPCSNCLYATDSYRLKCSVRPSEAFSEEAIGCQDFAQMQPADAPFRTFSDLAR